MGDEISGDACPVQHFVRSGAQLCKAVVAVTIVSCVSFVAIPLSGRLSDRIGRRKMYLLGAALTVVFGLLYFGMLENRVPAPVFLAVMLSLVPHDMMYGQQAALIGEALTPHSRFRGSSVGSQLNSVIAGGRSALFTRP